MGIPGEAAVKADIPAGVLEQEEIAPGVFYIKLARTGEFVPGQLLGLTTGEGQDLRYYSIASGREDDYWGILYDRVEEGALTPRLSEMHPGDTVLITKAFGEFLPGRSSMVWIATGSGIAPFYAMLRSGLGEHRNILIHGAREREGFYFYDDLKGSWESGMYPVPPVRQGRASIPDG